MNLFKFCGDRSDLETNFKGEIIDAKLTSVNVQGIKLVLELAKNIKGMTWSSKFSHPS